MKRAPELTPLSHDHQHALAIALALRRASAASAAEARASFLAYWHAEGRRHFQLEEELLLPAYARHAEPDDPLVVRVLVDHVAIRRDAATLAREAEPPLELLHALGARIDAHVRHEERALFPRVERSLTPDELALLGAELAGR